MEREPKRQFPRFSSGVADYEASEDPLLFKGQANARFQRHAVPDRSALDLVGIPSRLLGGDRFAVHRSLAEPAALRIGRKGQAVKSREVAGGLDSAPKIVNRGPAAERLGVHPIGSQFVERWNCGGRCLSHGRRNECGILRGKLKVQEQNDTDRRDEEPFHNDLCFG